MTLIPGEILTAEDEGDIEINVGRVAVDVEVHNTGDRPVQVGSHYHFFEVNPALAFDRGKARGMRLDIPAGTAVRFEPGQGRVVRLVALAGRRHVPEDAWSSSLPGLATLSAHHETQYSRLFRS